jgi:hypothetical protein
MAVIMRMRHGVGLAVVAGVVVIAPAAVARADEVRRAPPWAIRFEPGVVIPGGHMTDSGLVSRPPPVYVGASLERTIVAPLRGSVSGGISLLMGWLIGSTIRCAVYDSEAIALSVGAGPLLAPDARFGAAAFVQIDAVLQVRITGSVGLVVGTSAGFALNSAGSKQSGVDTGRAYVEPGDVFTSWRAGVGFAF